LACPYAKTIRGTVAHCSIVNKKVSTLRYPCKGNYKRCPIYIRYSSRAAKTKQPARQEAPAAQPAPQQPATPTIPEQPSTPTPAPVEAQPTPAITPTSIGVEAPKRGGMKPSKALCDTLILASLLAGAKSLGVYRGPLSGVKERIEEIELKKGTFVFVTGDIDGYKFRALYAGDTITFALFRGGSPVCGEEAERLLQELADKKLDANVYEVYWEKIPLWRDKIRMEIGGG